MEFLRCAAGWHTRDTKLPDYLGRLERGKRSGRAWPCHLSYITGMEGWKDGRMEMEMDCGRTKDRVMETVSDWTSSIKDSSILDRKNEMESVQGSGIRDQGSRIKHKGPRLKALQSPPQQP